MKLKSIEYREWAGYPQEWNLESLSLHESDLIVGKNATGKSRCLSIVHSLAMNLLGKRPLPISASYRCEFVDGDSTISYDVDLVDQGVHFERFVVDGIVLLERNADGIGKISAVELDTVMTFQTPYKVLAAVTRQDTIQHPFLERLLDWAISVRHFQFGGSLGRQTLLMKGPPQPNAPFDENDTEFTPQLLARNLEQLGTGFKSAIIDDLAKINYHVSDITVEAPISIIGFPDTLQCITLKEIDLPGTTDQISISQGMYRVLAVLAQLNYFAIKGNSPCILLDDIGEGLDYERSQLFIQLVREKALATGAQLIMTSNDKYVMNAVPLEDWTILKRTSNNVSVHNYDNSREVFERFSEIGLTNFSFFEMDFISSAAPEIIH